MPSASPSSSFQGLSCLSEPQALSGFQCAYQMVLIRQTDCCGLLPRKLRPLILQKCLSPRKALVGEKQSSLSGVFGGHDITPAASGAYPVHTDGSLSLGPWQQQALKLYFSVIIQQ